MQISSVSIPTISGGDVIMSCDFSNIYNIKITRHYNITTTDCHSSNKPQIICTIGAAPCSVEYSPFDKCNDHVGNCICNDIAIVTGGQVYLNGNFSNVYDLSLTKGLTCEESR
ncbi:hypothetical protein DDB_G0270976 [Dictyostelium discoideum AX4]|uniref:Uncharacterized protein n=1 Tax=Dictyostelium discoideum TaxID=44689 RepID=Q55CX7_DICDI|nr:hypothetical protein DDB_G0270976 [Dictyostelium discoideum AX4]EAL72838.1 hypothetical protein DDB_G0270976 [Dictyostelium discoideum AX4]|eukprot:XP_646354.1 hypothetical protein DDB_G0270976 [Dictyostelium discoideum AX4]